MRIAVLGAGSLGGLIAGALAGAGIETTLLARGETARIIAERGIAIEGALSASGRPKVVVDPGRLGEVDVVLVAVKTYDTEQALAEIEPSRVGAAASLQNGVLKDDLLRSKFGPGKVLGCATQLGGQRIAPDRIRCMFPGKTFFGEFDGSTSPRLDKLADAFTVAGLPVERSTVISSLEWTKAVLQAATAPLAAIVGRPLHEIYLGPAAALYVHIVREAAAIAKACGVDLDGEQPWGGPMAALLSLDDAAAVELVQSYGRDFVARGATQIRISMQQDVAAGRPTEIDETAGHLVNEGRRLGIPTPYLDAACTLTRALIR